MRGRNRPKGPNPLTRSYESTGPDVKIRGTAQHIADKYAQLARDALASGDPVAAENYFQHGEHYFRIITGAQEPNRPQATQGYARNGFDEEEEGDEDMQGPNGADQGRQGYGGDEYGDPTQQPQPFERQDYEARHQNRGNDRPDMNRQDRGQGQDRNDRRDRFQNRNDRPQRFDSNRQDYNRGEFRQDQPRQDQPRQDYGRQDQARPDQNRQDYGRQDYSRQDAGRHDQSHQDQPRQEQPRQDHSRQDQPRYENGRGNYNRQDVGRPDRNRQDAGRQDAPRQDVSRDEAPPSRSEQPRRERSRREEPRQVVDETSALPAFLMTATRNPGPEAGTASEPTAVPQHDPASDDTMPAPKPRRRRTRYKASEGEAGAAPENTEGADIGE